MKSNKSWHGKAEFTQLQDAVAALNVTPNSEVVVQLRDVSQRAAQENRPNSLSNRGHRSKNRRTRDAKAYRVASN
jgi:hypothetical protein